MKATILKERLRTAAARPEAALVRDLLKKGLAAPPTTALPRPLTPKAKGAAV